MAVKEDGEVIPFDYGGFPRQHIHSVSESRLVTPDKAAQEAALMPQSNLLPPGVKPNVDTQYLADASQRPNGPPVGQAGWNYSREGVGDNVVGGGRQIVESGMVAIPPASDQTSYPHATDVHMPPAPTRQLVDPRTLDNMEF
jgi:hypothetical protein